MKQPFFSIGKIKIISFVVLMPGLLFNEHSELHAAVDISTAPPGLQTTTPNIVVTLDDSGSMEAPFMPDTSKSNNWIEYYSKSWNSIYYDPNITYSPPPKADGSSFPNATYTDAWIDGICANITDTCPTLGTQSLEGLTPKSKFDLRTQFDKTPFFPSDSTITSVSGQPVAGGFYAVFDLSNANCGGVDESYNNSNCYDPVTLAQNTWEQQNFANWYAYYRTRHLLTRTSLLRAFSAVGNNVVRIAWQNINANLITNSTTINSFSATVKDDFFKFIYTSPASGATPNRNATLLASEMFTRTGNNTTNPYWDAASGKEISCRQNFHLLATDGYWSETTPSPPTGFFDEQDNELLGNGLTSYSNSAVDTRVYWNLVAPLSSVYPSLSNIGFYYWAKDLRSDLPNNVPPYFPNVATDVTGAAISGTVTAPEHYNDTEGSAFMASTYPQVFWNPANDPANWQHVVQFMVTLGVNGTLSYPSDLVAVAQNTKQWPEPKNSNVTGIDDTWHAAVNSRGGYFSANDPQTLVDSLSLILSNITARSGSSSAATLSSGLLQSSTVAYEAGYSTSDGSGSLKAFSIDPDTGNLSTSAFWDAGCTLSGGNWSGTECTVSSTPPDVDTQRVVFTSDGSAGNNHGKAFIWNDLTSTQKTSLAVTGDLSGYAQLRVDYVRGNRSQEGSGANFHTRSSVLGSIINSQAIYVGYPSGRYGDFPAGSNEANAANTAPSGTNTADNGTYEQFVENHKCRQPALYVGANDGMLHAFDALTSSATTNGCPAYTTNANGQELWAYVPAAVIGNLSKLTNATNYTITPFVDSPPVVRDVFTNGQWRTLLIGALRLGGRAIYALDVTNPLKSENSNKNDVLWEFSSLQSGFPADFQFTGTPNIAYIPYGGSYKWVVLVSGGYVPEKINGVTYTPPSGYKTTQSALFVLDAANGALLHTFYTKSGTTSQGLAPPIVASYAPPVDGAAFAGDLNGNLWRFDLASLSANKVDLVFQTPGGTNQPITVMPRLFLDTGTNRLTAVFGTGKYMGGKDQTTTISTQAFYGIRENGVGGATVQFSNLQPQTLAYDSSSGAFSITSNTVSSSKDGWYFNLARAGERNISPAGALFSSHRAILTTLLPGSDPCTPGYGGSTLVIDALTGGAPEAGAFYNTNSGYTTAPGYSVIGFSGQDMPVVGGWSVLTTTGGGQLILPGSGLSTILDSYWRQKSWGVIR